MSELPYIKKVGERGDLQIWIVDGAYIRSRQDEEFTNYGQHYRYPYIPVNELWLDREADEDEQQFTCWSNTGSWLRAQAMRRHCLGPTGRNVPNGAAPEI